MRDLLRHTSGLPLDASLVPSWLTLSTSTAPVAEQRRLIVSELLQLTPDGPRGTFNYLDSGYIAAGAMLEELTGESWEALLQREVFDPLEMSTAGFGAPGTADLRDQPLGHRWQGDRWQAVEPGAQADNPAAGPAGTVHASLTDYARFMALHLAGARGESQFHDVNTFRACTRRRRTVRTRRAGVWRSRHGPAAWPCPTSAAASCGSPSSGSSPRATSRSSP